LGEKWLIAFQYVSEPTPKPSWSLQHTEGKGPAFEFRSARRLPDIRVHGMSAAIRSSRKDEHGCRTIAARDTAGVTLLAAQGVVS